VLFLRRATNIKAKPKVYGKFIKVFEEPTGLNSAEIKWEKIPTVTRKKRRITDFSRNRRQNFRGVKPFLGQTRIKKVNFFNLVKLEVKPELDQR
jgi:hypothetical protein